MADLINLGNQLANDFPDKASGNFITSAFGKMAFSIASSKQTQKELAEFFMNKANSDSSTLIHPP